ncbi:MAG: PRD domain-containing protein [Erysipelotrichaceae bacterium]|nr:PRD domain-containing protein [Erysipelotrichaceae bacterium]
MVIKRILTNNAVVIEEDGKDKIVCGKGIAFKKRPGMVIEDDAINQTFILAPDNKLLGQLETLIENIPIEYVELSNKIVNMARISMNVKLSDTLIISLADHIYESKRRYDEGIQLSNGLIWDIKRFYEKEFEIGMLGKQLCEEALNVKFNDDEAAYIAIHIVNSETDGSTVDQALRMTKLIQELVQIVQLYYGVLFDETSGYYYRFITHLKYFSKRVLTKEQFECVENHVILLILK